MTQPSYTDRPAVPGAYWVRAHHDRSVSGWLICEVRLQRGQVNFYLTGSKEAHQPQHRGQRTEFYGPLPLPGKEEGGWEPSR